MAVYTPEEQAKLADELVAMGGRYPTVERVVADFGTVRAQCRVSR